MIHDWTPTDQHAAEPFGWGVFTVFDLKRQRAEYMADFLNGEMPTEGATRFLIERARQGDALAIKALRAVYHSVTGSVPEPKKRKKK